MLQCLVLFPLGKDRNIYGKKNVVLCLISVQTSLSVCVWFECSITLFQFFLYNSGYRMHEADAGTETESVFCIKDSDR